MSETWTEYGVRWTQDGELIGMLEKDREGAEETAAWMLAHHGIHAIVVGRQVTASDWLPVTEDGVCGFLYDGGPDRHKCIKAKGHSPEPRGGHKCKCGAPS